MWRYAPLLPAADLGASVVSLGEGLTPLVRARRFGQEMSVGNLWVKDDGANPVGCSEARGCSCAISMALQLGVRDLSAVTDGVAGAALACYAAAAGLKARICLPPDAPVASFVACGACGAEVVLAMPAEGLAPDSSPFSEPYRLEGLKTLGYEIAEQLRWDAPDAIVCPVGGGGHFLGISKAFEELEAIGWTVKRPRLIAVQAEGCRPLVDAFESGSSECAEARFPHTIALGVRVPQPPAGSLVLETLRARGGCAVAVSDQEILDAGTELAHMDGVLTAPEGAACAAALSKLLARGFIRAEETVVLVNTASGHLYGKAYSARFPRRALTEQDKLGGLITPH
jgi:threonine synthase